ncbi:MAG: S46 family peptidase [candidate division KSB1 bacterium]|nr:S46 family peptidase [candidate division KSB1 bacterium]
MNKFFPFILLLFLIFIIPVHADEGMYPISDIQKLDLKAKGLQLEPLDIFNPDGISLVDAICKVDGGTGSFVSPDGLILTNHHIAFGAVQAASTPEHDYLKNGFLAKNKAEEYPAKGFTVRITESYQDVSDEVLSAVTDQMELAERSKAIDKKIKEIVIEAEESNPGKRAEVAEMFIGKTYVLFIYTYLRDIRLVYAPPRGIGNFGGEEDNWTWPRHTGDFSFMRAYVAPDGTPADYSPDNVPYRPKNYLKIAPQGVDEGDFVFILGYPGRTYRHQTSFYLDYEQEVRMPYVVQWYQWQIELMQQLSRGDRAIALKHDGRIKSLANVEKNYRGKLLGMRRLNLVEKKRAEERELQQFIEADSTRRAKYGNLLNEIEAIYQQMRSQAERDLVLTYLLRSSTALNNAYTVYEASIERQKKDLERASSYMDRNFDRTKERLFLNLREYYEPSDRAIFKAMLLRAAQLPAAQQIPAIKKLFGTKNPEQAIDRFLDKAYLQTVMTDEKALADCFKRSPDEIKKIDDPFIKLAMDLYPTYKQREEQNRSRQGAIDKLYAQLIDVKKDFLAKDFVPDANGTLRLTYGYIRGYSPRDAIYAAPITTATGILEKATGEEPFDAPQKLIHLINAKDFGRFAHPKLNSVPVAILYNMDTTGGNSGSPVLNARGELVGLNFDRAFEATINDYAWSEAYSRSIAVDIRYVLWVTEKVAGAEHLLQEMQVAD